MKKIYSRRTRLKTSILVILFAGMTSCSSIQPVKDYRTSNVSIPQIKPVDIDAGDQVFSGKDYKLRSKKTDRIQILFIRQEEQNQDIPVHLRMIAKRKLFYLIEKSGAEVFDLPETLLNGYVDKDQQYRDYLEEKQIDGVVTLNFNTEDEKRPRINIRMIDPVDDSEMASIDFALNEEMAGSRDRQVEFYLARDGYHFIDSLSFTNYSLKALTLNTVRKLVNRSVSARIIIMASVPDAVVVLRDSSGKKVTGTLPMDTVLDEGLYSIEVRKRGVKTQRREFRIRAGKEQSLFFSWGGDPDRSSLAVYSAPGGLRFSLDGSVIGYTPVFRSSMQSGIYQMELASSEDGNEYSVEQSQDLGIHLGEHNEVAYFIDYDMSRSRETLFEMGLWQATSEEGRVQVKRQEDGFTLKAGKAGDTARMGIVSRPIPVLGLDMVLTLPGTNTPPLLFGLTGQANSVFVEGTEAGYQPLLFNGSNLETTGTAYEMKPENKQKDREIRFRYNQESGNIRVYLNGKKIFEQRVDLSAKARIAILSNTGGADGRLFVKNFTIQSRAGMD